MHGSLFTLFSKLVVVGLIDRILSNLPLFRDVTKQDCPAHTMTLSFGRPIRIEDCLMGYLMPFAGKFSATLHYFEVIEAKLLLLVDLKFLLHEAPFDLRLCVNSSISSFNLRPISLVGSAISHRRMQYSIA